MIFDIITSNIISYSKDTARENALSISEYRMLTNVHDYKIEAEEHDYLMLDFLYTLISQHSEK
jgi:hypothetical protein